MNNRASQSIRLGTTTGVFVVIILTCNGVGWVVNPGYKSNEQQAYPTIDTKVHIDEKDVRECKGCARFPMARIVVSSKKKSLVNDSGIHRKYFTDKLLKRPKLQSRQSLKVFFKLKEKIEIDDNVPNCDQSISLSSFLYRTCRGS